MTTTCRRCSECVGQDHHWIENDRLVDETDPYFICKHCEAACDEADPEEGFAEPSGVLRGQPAICDGCDFYEKDCQCGEAIDGPEDDRDDRRAGCVLGKECLAPDPFHRPDECFDADMAEAYMAPDVPTPGPNGCTCGFNGDCNCPFKE